MSRGPDERHVDFQTLNGEIYVLVYHPARIGDMLTGQIGKAGIVPQSPDEQDLEYYKFDVEGVVKAVDELKLVAEALRYFRANGMEATVVGPAPKGAPRELGH